MNADNAQSIKKLSFSSEHSGHKKPHPLSIMKNVDFEIRKATSL